MLCLFPLPVQGEQADLQAIYEEQYDASGAEGLVPLVPEEAGDLLKELDITPENVAEGASLPAWLEALGRVLRERLGAPTRTLGICLCVAVVAAFARVMQGQSKWPGLPEDLGGMAAFLAMVPPLIRLIDSAAGAIKGAGAFMLGAAPVYTGVLVAMGKSVSAGTFGGLMVAAGNGVTLLAGGLVIPLLYILLVFSGVCALAAPEFSRLTEGAYGVLRWLLLLTVTVFTGLLSVQGVLSGAADTVAGKTAKLVVKSAVPVVGSLISDATGAVQASVTLLRSGIGAFVLLALLAVFLPLLAEHAVWIAVLAVASAAADLLGLGRLAGLFSGCKTVVQTLFACTVSCGVVLVVCAGIILAMGGGA